MRAWMLFVLVSVMVGPASAQQSAVRFGRVIKVERAGDSTLVTVAAGTEQGIDRTMFARVVTTSGGDESIPGGELMLVRVDKRTTIGKTAATIAQVTGHPWVRFQPTNRVDAMTAPL